MQAHDVRPVELRNARKELWTSTPSKKSAQKNEFHAQFDAIERPSIPGKQNHVSDIAPVPNTSPFVVTLQLFQAHRFTSQVFQKRKTGRNIFFDGSSTHMEVPAVLLSISL